MQFGRATRRQPTINERQFQMMLTSVQIAIPILCVVFGSAVVGLTVSKRLAPHHLSP